MSLSDKVLCAPRSVPSPTAGSGDGPQSDRLTSVYVERPLVTRGPEKTTTLRDVGVGHEVPYRRYRVRGVPGLSVPILVLSRPEAPIMVREDQCFLNLLLFFSSAQ